MRVLPLVVAVLTAVLVAASVCPAQERHGPSTRSARAARRAAVVAPKAVENPPAPVLSDDATWAGRVLIGFAALVLAGLVIGPLYRSIVPEDLVPSHSHDEPPGSSHRHGPGGERARPED